MSAPSKESSSNQPIKQYSSVASKVATSRPCHFYLAGKCLKGASCPFSHFILAKEGEETSAANLEGFPLAVCEDFDDTINVRLGGLLLELPGQNLPTFRSYNEAVGTFGSASHILQSHKSAAPAVLRDRVGVSSAPPKRKELCIFAMTGKCKFGLMCRSVHGIQCPRCLKFCLHPDDLDQNEDHIQQCFENPPSSALETEDEKKISCGLCHEPVLSRPDPRFGLLNCDHAFCINCIRSWRTKFSTDATNLRSCPLCRTVTYFVVPSSVWVSDPEEKQIIIEAYKKKLSVIPCKHYAHGINSCPFGTSCFYAHASEDGTLDKQSIRTVVNSSEKITVCRDTRLSDFIIFKQK